VKDFYTIAGRSILIEAHDDWSARAFSNVFSSSFLTPVGGDGSLSADTAIGIRFGTSPPCIPDGLFQFDVPQGGSCHTDGINFYFDFDGSRIVIGSGASRKVDVWITKRYEFESPVLAQIISQAFSAALRRCDVFEFHSAAVVSPGSDKALLIAGPSGSGKTALTLQLATCGWNYLSDDSLLLHIGEQGLEACALRKSFGLTQHTISALQLSELMRSSSLHGVKWRVTPQDLFPANQLKQAQPSAVLFPTVSRKSTTQIHRLPAAEAMTRLLRLCPWAGYDKTTGAKHLALLSKLARDCVAFDLFAGYDVLENRGLAAELLEALRKR
jgi:hypothetical protein